jgi:hypothetical protein
VIEVEQIDAAGDGEFEVGADVILDPDGKSRGYGVAARFNFG